MTAAVIARALNRTLCLTPFFQGPLKHRGKDRGLQNNKRLLDPEYRYNLEQLSKFVRISSGEACRQQCNSKLDAYWMLRKSKKPIIKKWRRGVRALQVNLDWSFVNWNSVKDIESRLSGEIDKCVGLGGLLPGLGWRGAYFAVSAYLQPSDHTRNAAQELLQKLIRGIKDNSFLAVHWRFQESDCGGYQPGLCFVRCEDGAVVNSGLHGGSWKVEQHKQHYVVVTGESIIAGIYSFAQKHGLATVYLATDGWMRGRNASQLVKKVVLRLRAMGVDVAGLWRIKDLPNMSDGTYVDFTSLQSGFSAAGISLMEQELCRKATAFLGSGQSSWSLAVYYQRIATRRAHDMIKSEKLETETDVINRLMEDTRQAGLVCRYRPYANRSNNNGHESWETTDEKESWLDFEACEKQQGGRCKRARLS